MTMQTSHNVTCDGTRRKGCTSYASSADTKMEALSESRREGFRRVKVKNGSYWDFCSSCYEKWNRGEI